LPCVFRVDDWNTPTHKTHKWMCICCNFKVLKHIHTLASHSKSEEKEHNLQPSGGYSMKMLWPDNEDRYTHQTMKIQQIQIHRMTGNWYNSKQTLMTNEQNNTKHDNVVLYCLFCDWPLKNLIIKWSWTCFRLSHMTDSVRLPLTKKLPSHSKYHRNLSLQGKLVVNKTREGRKMHYAHPSWTTVHMSHSFRSTFRFPVPAYWTCGFTNTNKQNIDI